MLFPTAQAQPSPASASQHYSPLNPPSATQQSFSPVQGLQLFAPPSPYSSSPSSAGGAGLSGSPRTPSSSHPNEFDSTTLPTLVQQQQHPFHATHSSPTGVTRPHQLRVSVTADALLSLAQPAINSRSHLPTTFTTSTPTLSPTQMTTIRRTALHAIQSLVLLAQLAHTQSRPVEGHKHLGAALRLALACNLHRLPAPLPNLRGAVDGELEAARETWWMVFCTERAWAGAGLGVEGEGISAMVDDGGIVTPFGSLGIMKSEWGGLEVIRPIGLNGHATGQEQVRRAWSEHEHGIKDMNTQENSTDIVFSATESMESLSAKTYALAARASELSVRWTATHDPALTSIILRTLSALDYLSSSPPTVKSAPGSPSSPVARTTEVQLVALSSLSQLQRATGDSSATLCTAQRFAHAMGALEDEVLGTLHGSFGRHILGVGRTLCEESETAAEAESLRKTAVVCMTRMPYLGDISA